MKYVPALLLAAAIGTGLLASGAEDPARQRMLSGWAALLLGLAMAGSGARALSQGEVHVVNRDAKKDEQPVTFWTAVILSRFGPAALFVGVGAWYLSS